MVQGLEWIYNNRQRHNIRVVNISINSSELESAKTSPLSAAVQALWFSGVVVVVSAGNNGGEALYPPANDPFVITVGATDDRGTRSTADDRMAAFSAFGRTTDGFMKPDLVAPGTNIVSSLLGSFSTLASLFGDNRVGSSHFRMSGTSMAAPMVSGAVALLLQAEPVLSPDEVKFRLTATARPFSTKARAGAGHLDIAAAVNNPNRLSGRANQDVAVNSLLAANDNGLVWNTATNGSVNWGGKGSSFFGSVNWSGKTTGTRASLYWEK
jgi:serine protease AprX